MKFKNKKTGSIVRVASESLSGYYIKNPDWEEIKEVEEVKEEPKEEIKEEKEEKELTVAEIKAQLDELGIEYDKKANKKTLLASLPQKS